VLLILDDHHWVGFPFAAGLPRRPGPHAACRGERAVNLEAVADQA
jgi:hypothetical protein